MTPLITFRRSLVAMMGSLLALAAPACGSGTDTLPIGGGVGGDTTSTSTSTSTSGGGSTSSSSGSSSSSGAGGGASGCKTPADCKDPKKAACDVKTGDCVECLPTKDTCPMGEFCNPQNACVAGCKNQTDCSPPTVCDAKTNQCVGCVGDGDCMPGAVCMGATCVAGCTAMHACAGTDTCCTASCHDLQSDVTNCGTCGIACPPPAHGTATCTTGMCGIACDAAWADCNLDLADGCEQNVLQDGPCLCMPGATQPCYDGAPGTEGVGVCVGGTQTCDPSGLLWGLCAGEIIPSQQLCLGKDENCDGIPQPAGCSPCVPGVGVCNGNVGTYCPDGLGNVVETCDPLEGMTCVGGQCQGACSKASLGFSNVGCDYFPTVTANLVGTQWHFAVAVSNTSANSATVTITKGAAVVTTVTVAANSVQIVTLPWVLTLKGPASLNATPFPASVRVNQGAYRLRSTQPVSVYQFNPIEYTNGGNCVANQANCSFSNDASILLPTNVWTGTYRVAARHHFGGMSGFYAVTARDDNTVVTVAAGPGGGLVKAGVAGIPASGNGTVTLNSGDVIEVVTNGGAGASDPNDVTGTLVSATKPVQVIGGHQCVYIPDAVGYCDHLEETMFPYETLSQKYIVTAPLILPANGPAFPKVEMVRIVATQANTALTYDPVQPGAPSSIAQAGAWVEIANTAKDFQISANQPILVVQYMEGQDAGGGSGDPAMSIGVPNDQFRSSYLFHAPTNYTTNYINVTAPTGTVVTLDGAVVPGFAGIGGTGFSIARAPLSNAGTGNHTISAAAAFGISVYGYGQYTSYWYPGGAQVAQLHN